MTSETLFAASEHEHEFYVKPSQVQKGDVVIATDDLSNEILADLAKSHPREFAKAAIDRGVLELETDDEEEGGELGAGDDDEEEYFTEEQERFQAASAAEAIALVKAAAADPAKLAVYAEAEEGKDKPRKTVLEAIAAAIAE